MVKDLTTGSVSRKLLAGYVPFIIGGIYFLSGAWKRQPLAIAAYQAEAGKT